MAVSGHSGRLLPIPFPRIPDADLVHLLWTYATERSQELTAQVYQAQVKRVFDFGTMKATGERILPPKCHEFVLDRREAAEFIASRCVGFSS
jgi:hypothetical protein